MGFYYDFYKIYQTKEDDVKIWNGKSIDELPEHLQFFCDEYDNSDFHNELEEIQKYVFPINMYIDNQKYEGYLATLYPVALLGKDAYLVTYKLPRNSWYHFVRLTNSKAKRLIKFAINECRFRFPDVYTDEYIKGILGKDNKYKHYKGKLRHIVFYQHQ